MGDILLHSTNRSFTISGLTTIFALKFFRKVSSAKGTLNCNPVIGKVGNFKNRIRFVPHLISNEDFEDDTNSPYNNFSQKFAGDLQLCRSDLYDAEIINAAEVTHIKVRKLNKMLYITNIHILHDALIQTKNSSDQSPPNCHQSLAMIGC